MEFRAFCKRVLRNLFPFLRLCEAHPGLCPYRPGIAERFFVQLSIWLTAVFLLCYAILTMSSETFIYSKVSHGMIRKEPTCGKHMSNVLLFKRILEWILLARLCGPLMKQGEEDAEHYRTQEVDMMRGIGVVNWCRERILRRTAPRWLSSFFPDYILLVLVFPASLLFQIYLWVQKVDAYRETGTEEDIYTDWKLPEHEWLIHADSFFFVYLSVLVIGFLFTTLEYHLVASPECRGEFTAVLSLFIVLWSMNFFTTQDDRYTYAAAWGYMQTNSFFRSMAALAQVFITHSTVMLGAILLGHSEHLRRTPDMSCNVLCYKFVPSLVVLIFFLFFSLSQREIHNHNMDCVSSFSHVLNAVWPWVEFLLPCIGGPFLLITSFLGRWLVKEEAEAESKMEIDYDYDSTLIVATVSMAVFFHVNRIYEMEAARLWGNVVVEALQLLGPIGLATFAFYSWKKPPLRTGGGIQHFRSTCCLWFAFVYAGAMFAVFQTMEDCETSSDLPQCCNYPGINREYTHPPGLMVTCDKELRCMKPFVKGAEICALPHHLGSGPGSLAANITAQKQEKFDEATCRKLQEAWEAYRTKSVSEGTRHSAQQDAEHEEEMFSSAFRLFRTIGQAASVEMYFTIFGVLLKLIFLTQHPESARILKSDEEYHEEHQRHTEPARLHGSMISLGSADGLLVDAQSSPGASGGLEMQRSTEEAEA